MMSAVTLTVGISLAYYNTCSLAFDTEPVIASVDDDNITFLDFSDKIKRSKSFEDLFELSKIDALNMINQFFLGEDTYKITQNKSFLTGVEVK